jgi:DNA-binding NtrC family response regulator
LRLGKQAEIPRSGLIFGYVLKCMPGCYRLDREKGRKMSKLKLLYGELNEEVLATQAAELEKAGYAVQSAIGRKAVQDLLKKESFDLVVLGQTLTRDDRHHLPYMVKKAQAGAKVLVLHTDGSRHPYVDGNIDTGSDMQHFLDKISAMFQQSKPQSKAQQSKTMAATSGR